MNSKILKPVCAFDLGPDGPVEAVGDWLGVKGFGAFRWVHLDLLEKTTGLWIESHLPEVAATHLMQAETRPRFEQEESGLLLNLRGVNMDEGAVAEDMVSIRLWVTDDAIVSARMRKVLAIDDLRRDITEGRAPKSVGGFLLRLVRGLTDRIEAVSLKLEDDVDALEEGATGDIGALRQKAIKLRRYVGPQREALNELAEDDTGLLDTTQRARMRELANRTARIVEELDASRDRLLALQDATLATHQATLTQNNYILAIVAAIFLPLGFLTGLFGVNLGGMPGTESPLAFGVLCLGLLAIGAGLAVLFKRMGWF